MEGQTGVPLPGGSTNNGVSSAQALRLSGALFFSAITATIGVLALSQRKSAVVAFICVAVLCASVAPTALAPSAAVVDLTVDLPAGFALTDLSARIADGSVISTGAWTVRTASFDLCGNPSNIVNLNGLTALRQLLVCAGGQVTLANIRQSSGLLSNVTSESSSVSVGFAGSYVGRWNAKSNSGSISSSGGSCLAGSASGSSSGPSTGSGTCQVDLFPDPQLSIDASTGVTLSLGAQVCTASWIADPPAEFVAPSSPTMSTSRPAQAWTLLSYVTSWRAVTIWGGWPDSGIVQFASGFSIPITRWWPNWYFVFSRADIPMLRAGYQYTFSYKFAANRFPGNVTVPTIEYITTHLANNPVWVDSWKINETQWDSMIGPSIVMSSPSTTTGFTAGSYLPVSWTFTPQSDISAGRLFIEIKFSTAIEDNYWQMNVTDLTITQSPQPWTAPTLVSGASEKVTIPPMPSALDPNPRTAADCPHLRSGLKHWHDPATWTNNGNQVPTGASTITLPSGSSVLISSCSLSNTVYQKIVIPVGTELIFADAPINMRVRNILVQGKLSIGSPTCRLNAPVNITFIGPKVTTDEIDTNYGAKGIGVAGTGQIDIHGFQFHPTWTRIAASIRAGDNRIYLQDAVNWAVGQRVVVATTLYRDYETDQNEEMTIVSISEDGKVLETSTAFKFSHYGGSEYQAEVGLLSRRINIQGDSASDADKFGGHIMVMGQGRFSGVQFYKMGQQNMLARYPVHWHLIGSSPNSFAKDNSFWNGFYRCISIHATHDTTVLRNVAWNTAGHCYYLEEGVEENNTISFNLAVHIRCIGPPMTGGGQRGEVFYEDATALLPADRAAAGFYITNAYNTFIGNAASGGWAGFSFPNLPTPLGFNKDRNFSPQRRVTKVFDGNTVHSSGYHFAGDGGCIYVGGKLWYSSGVLTYDNGRYSRGTSFTLTPGTPDYQDPLWMRFTNTKAFLCQIGLSHWGERADVVNFEVHDSGRSVQLFGESWYGNALINAKSGNPVGFPYDQGQMGFQFYDTWVKTMVTNVVFRNFVPRDPADPSYYGKRTTLTSLNFSDRFKPQGISATKGITFENVPVEIRIGHTLANSGSARYFNFVDWDGSWVGANGPRIVGSAHEGDWWNFDSGCIKRSEWNVWICPKAGTREIGNLEILVPLPVPGIGGASRPFITGWEGDEYPANDDWKIGNMTLWGPGIPAGRKTAITRNSGVTGVTNIGWYMFMQRGTPRTMTISPYVIPRNGFIMFAARYPSSCTFDIFVSHLWIGGTGRWKNTTASATFADTFNGDGTKYFWDSSNGFLFLKLRIFSGPWSAPTDPNPSMDGFSRDGVTVWSIQQAQIYNVVATCPGYAGQDFLPVTDVHPGSYWTS